MKDLTRCGWCLCNIGTTYVELGPDWRICVTCGETYRTPLGIVFPGALLVHNDLKFHLNAPIEEEEWHEARV